MPGMYQVSLVVSGVVVSAFNVVCADDTAAARANVSVAMVRIKGPFGRYSTLDPGRPVRVVLDT